MGLCTHLNVLVCPGCAAAQHGSGAAADGPPGRAGRAAAVAAAAARQLRSSCPAAPGEGCCCTTPFPIYQHMHSTALPCTEASSLCALPAWTLTVRVMSAQLALQECSMHHAPCILSLVRACHSHAQPATASAAVAAGLPAAAAYGASSLVLRLSVKLFGATPGDLPAGLRAQLTGWLCATPAGAECFMRPGCVLLTMQARPCCLPALCIVLHASQVSSGCVLLTMQARAPALLCL